MGLAKRAGRASLVVCAEGGVVHVPSPVVGFVRSYGDVDFLSHIRDRGSAELLVWGGEVERVLLDISGDAEAGFT